MSDVCISVDGYKLNVRVGALIVHDGSILVCRLPGAKWWFVPGGRVKVNETSVEAIERELNEEVGRSFQIRRARVVCENFFVHEGVPFHELCTYYLVDWLGEDRFQGTEHATEEFAWVDRSSIGDLDLKPSFLKSVFERLDAPLELIVHREDKRQPNQALQTTRWRAAFTRRPLSSDDPSGVSELHRSPRQMRHRIRGASLVVRDDRMLLVRHLERKGGEDYWIPPGGGMELEDSSIFACAERETFEETGYRVFGRSILYIQEFVDHTYQCRNMEFFILGELVGGEMVVPAESDQSADSPVVWEIGWFSKDEMMGMEVYPARLKDEFWTDRHEPVHETRHLGTKAREEAGEPGATDNPDDAQRVREDH